MAKQTNTPLDWRLLAERDMAVADHLAATMAPVPTEIITRKKSLNCFRDLTASRNY